MPALVAIACCAVWVTACGGGDGSTRDTARATPSATADAGGGKIARHVDNANVSLRIGSKNFTEQRVLAEIYARGLAAAGYTVETHLNLGDEHVALKALQDRQIDAYPEYTGTALLSFFGKKASKLPRTPEAAYEDARQGFAASDPPLTAYPPTPFTSSNEVAVTRRTASRLHLKRISDLAGKAGSLTLSGAPECRLRRDCLLGLRQIYGLRFKTFMPINIDRRHQVLRDGRADVSIVFTTDPQIAREGEVLLADDKGMFPPYNSTLVVRKDVADAAGPDLQKTIALLQEQLTDDNMQELNARVDLDGKTPGEVAMEYLQETGLVSA